MPFGSRAGARTPIAQVVHVQPVQDGLEAALRGQRLELGVQVRLAEVAAVGRIARVALVLDLARVHQLVAQAEVAREPLRIDQLTGRQTGRDRRRGQRTIAQLLLRHDGDQRRVDARAEAR